MNMKRIKYIILLTFTTTMLSASNYSTRGSYQKWLRTKMPQLNNYWVAHKHYRDLDPIYIKYANRWNRRWKIPRNDKYRGIYTSPYILKALAWQESHWTPRINNKGVNSNRSVDYGLMQVNSRTDRRFYTASGISPADLINPDKNVKIAMHIFNYHARAGIRNGFNNNKDKLIYWLNSYNGKRTNNPHAYGQAIIYMANMLKEMHGMNDVNPNNYEDEKIDEIDTSTYNTEYDNAKVKGVRGANKNHWLLECTYPWKAPFNPLCN